MSIQNWSETIVVAELQDDPAFTDDMVSLTEQVQGNSKLNIILDMTHVTYLNSSNIARLIDLREQVTVKNQSKLLLCGVGTHVWGIMLVSELHKVFEFADNVATGLAAVQIGE
ncbi:MAG: STAS domain-containing protein [Phycisphaerales bacterium]|nr:MAG: STAS domain-containing protein [Phycisphaerales bacterium]